MLFHFCITETVQQGNSREATEVDITKFAANFLKYAPDREGGGGRPKKN